jgi:hypothetical protein
MTYVKKLIIKKYLQNLTYGSIYRDLSKFYVKRDFVNQTIKRYIETGSCGRRKYTTRKRFVTGRVVVKKIRERIGRKCDISARKLAADLKLNRETVRFVLKYDLQLSVYEKKKSLTYECNREEAFQTCENSAKLARENMFVLEQQLN